MAANKVKVLYILGAWRSGTTLLDRLLGQVKGFFSTGEIKVIWDRVFGHVWGLGEYSGEDVLCGCGIPFKSCPFWTGVFRQAFGGMEYVDSRRMFELRPPCSGCGGYPSCFVLASAAGFATTSSISLRS